jgi:hypothetical protein
MPERLTVRSCVPKSAAMVDAVCTTFPQVTSRKSAYPCSYASSGSHGGGEVATILNSRPPPPSCTLETYAGAKSLPVEFLKSPGLSDVTYSGSPGMRELRPSPKKARPARAARDASCSLESLEGLLEVQDHIPSVLDANREPHQVLPDPQPLPPRRRELAVRGGGRMDGEGVDVS